MDFSSNITYTVLTENKHIACYFVQFGIHVLT